MNKYDDIINLKHYTSKKYLRMSIYSRSAQFAPFAALTSYGDAINETERTTQKKKELDNDLKYQINDIIQNVNKNIKKHPKVKIVYYAPDCKKEGGAYKKIIDNVKKIDNVFKIIYLYKIKININEILDIEIVE